MEEKEVRAVEDKEEIMLSLAETFDSIQGEGYYTGTRMFFIRFAGCTVGRMITKDSPYELCRPVVGEPFICDTNYRFQHRLPLSRVLNLIPADVKHVSLTGGEPLAQKHLMEVVKHLIARKKMVHIETSGTIMVRMSHLFSRDKIWLTVSPKEGCLDKMVEQANQLKVLVGPGFNYDKLPLSVRSHPNVYLLPVSDIHDLVQANVKTAIALIANRRADWKLTTQVHKIWNVR